MRLLNRSTSSYRSVAIVNSVSKLILISEDFFTFHLSAFQFPVSFNLSYCVIIYRFIDLKITCIRSLNSMQTDIPNTNRYSRNITLIFITTYNLITELFYIY